MKKIFAAAQRLLFGEDGPTSVEYAVMLMLVFLACLLAIRSVGTVLQTNFDQSRQSIEDVL